MSFMNSKSRVEALCLKPVNAFWEKGLHKNKKYFQGPPPPQKKKKLKKHTLHIGLCIDCILFVIFSCYVTFVLI